MADRVRVTEVVLTSQVEAYTYRGDDGFPVAQVYSPVGVTTEDGREFFLPMGARRVDEEGYVFYRARYVAADMFAKVEKAGTIDPDYWVEIEPFDREAEYGFEAVMREREDALMGA